MTTTTTITTEIDPKTLAFDGAEESTAWRKSLARQATWKSTKTHYTGLADPQSDTSRIDGLDPVGLHYLVQGALHYGRGFRVLSLAELDAHKSELAHATAALDQARRQLAREETLEAGALGPLGRVDPAAALDAVRSGRARVQAAREEVKALEERVHRVERGMREHAAAVLGATHPGFGGALARVYAENTQSKAGLAEQAPAVLTPDPTDEEDEDEEDTVGELSRAASAPTRTLARGISLSRGASMKSLHPHVATTQEEEQIESLILTVGSLVPPAESPGALHGTRQKLGHLATLTRGLVRAFVGLEGDAQLAVETLGSPAGTALADAVSEYKSRMEGECGSLQDTIGVLETMMDGNSEVAGSGAVREMARLRERAKQGEAAAAGAKVELAKVVKSLEEVTRAGVEYERERGKLESQVRELEAKQREVPVQRNAVGSVPTSVVVLQQEFRRMLADVKRRHEAELARERDEVRRLQIQSQSQSQT